MLRRTFIASIVGAGLLAGGSVNASEETIMYLPGDLKEALDNGETVFAVYYTTWCSTCQRQDRVLEKLRAENPAYNKAMTFMKIDWDVYASHEVSTSRNIPRRSTLLVLKGDKELGRIVAGTSEAAIKELMDKGL